MIKEDYVSLETAKLLKEKGFNEDIDLWYDENGEMFIHTKYDIGHNWRVRQGLEIYQCPTLQMAMKWLREVHSIHINVFRYPAAFSGDDNEQHKPWWFQYTLLKPIKEIDIDSYNMNGEFESAEEAMDCTIKYCLENLI